MWRVLLTCFHCQQRTTAPEKTGGERIGETECIDKRKAHHLSTNRHQSAAAATYSSRPALVKFRVL